MDQPFKWTEEADAQLEQLHREGLTYAEIAARIGAPSRNSIGGRIMRLRDRREFGPPQKVLTFTPRVSRDRRTPGLAHVPLIKERLREGKTDREIAIEIGLRPDEIRNLRRIKKLAAARRQRPQPPAYAADVARLAAEELNDREIAEQLNITIWQARAERRRQKIKPTTIRPKRRNVTTISKGDTGEKIEAVFAEGFMGQRSRIGLLDLPLFGLCRFPIDQEEGPLRYCGDSVEDGLVYCSHHAARCYAESAPIKNLRPHHVYAPRS